jgi:hypothetical protein
MQMTILNRSGVRSILSVLLVTLAIASVGAQRGSSRVDVTGKWAFEVKLPNSTGTPSLTFKQEGEKLTGHYSSRTVGDAELKGTIKGQKIDFTVESSTPAGDVTIVYTGSVTAKDAMEGSLKVSNGAVGTFTGKRQ